MKGIVTALCFMLTGSTIVFSQGSSRNVPQRTVFVEYGDRMYADAIVVPHESRDSALITVFFRVANDFLSFTKVTNPNEVAGNFKADMKMSFELRDHVGVIRQRRPWSSTVYVSTFEETNHKHSFHYGWTTMTVTPGEYFISLEVVSQKESSQRRLSLPPITISKNAETIQLSAPVIFAEPSDAGDANAYRPYVNNGNVPFQAGNAVALLMIADARTKQYDYHIKQLPWAEREIRWWTVSDVRGEIMSEPSSAPVVSANSTDDQPLVTIVHQEQSKNYALLRVPVPVSGLVPGSYVMNVWPMGTTDTITVHFKVYWEMMPLSLRNISYAIEIMNYILTDDEYDTLDEGGDVDRRLKLMDYWRLNDPTPTTTYNEHMAEYFKRVDAAFFAYSTIQEPDGAHSDRGKIYILFGKPSSTRKSLSSEQRATEVWTYQGDIAKTFTFEIDDSGIHRLVHIAP